MIHSLFIFTKKPPVRSVQRNGVIRGLIWLWIAAVLSGPISPFISQRLSAQDQESSQQKTNPENKKPAKPEIRKHLSVPYATYDENQKLLCDVYMPSGKQGPFPAILMIHGGAWKSGTKLHMKFHAESAAKQGFVVVSINYRHAPRHKWPSQFEDCTKALRWMVSNKDKYGIDSKRIALWGYSAGGHLATYLALQQKNEQDRLPEIQCVVCGSAPVDLTVFPKDFPFLVYFMGATRREAPQKYEDASPISHLSKDAPPMFLYIGENDHQYFLQGMKNMAAKAKEVGAKCEMMQIPDKEHFLTFFDQPSYDKALEFIQKEMANAEKN